jgi:hypothetical protein
VCGCIPGSKLLSSTQESNDALVTPLLRSDVVSLQEEGEPDSGSPVSGFDMSGGSVGGSNGDLRIVSSPILRRCIYQVIQMRCAADFLPSLLLLVITSDKISFVAFAAVYLIFISLWFPFWLLSFVTTEWGVYLLAIVAVFFVGRSIIRLIAFPGASQKVTTEIEAEFAKYSVRMVSTAADSLIEIAAVLTRNDKTGGSLGPSYDVPVLWRRAKSYCDRVLGVYLEVLIYIFQQPSEPSLNNATSDLTKFGNNRLSGDVGNLSGLTVSDVDKECLNEGHCKRNPDATILTAFSCSLRQR